MTAVLHGSPDITNSLVLNGAPGRLAVDLNERGIDVTLVDHHTALARSDGVLAGTQVTTLPTSQLDGLTTSELVVAAPGFRRDPIARSRLLKSARATVQQDGRLVLVDRDHEEGDGKPLASVMDVARTGPSETVHFRHSAVTSIEQGFPPRRSRKSLGRRSSP